MTPPAFRRYLGIHYAGAETPDSGLKSLRVYSATPETPPQEVLPRRVVDPKGESRNVAGHVDQFSVHLLIDSPRLAQVLPRD